MFTSASRLYSKLPSRDLQIVSGVINAPQQWHGHRVKYSFGINNINYDHLSQFLEANDLIQIIGCLRQKTNQLPIFPGPNERVSRLNWILIKNIDKSHIAKINDVMPKIVRSDHTVYIANIFI